MIFISSACLKEKNLNKNLDIFNKNKLTNIELSGGTNYNSKTLKILNNLNNMLKVSRDDIVVFFYNHLI